MKLGTPRLWLQSLIAILSVVLVGLVLWPTPPAPIRGIRCEKMEGQAMHIHSQLQLWVNGQRQVIPATIGQVADCLYWLHTHTADGIIHMESPIARDFTLADLFAIWGTDPFPSSEGDAADPVLWLKRPGDRAFQRYAGPWRECRLTDQTILALGTGNFQPQDFSFPADLTTKD